MGNDTTNEFVQVAHKYGMMSLANTYSEQEIRDFDEREMCIRDRLGPWLVLTGQCGLSARENVPVLSGRLPGRRTR